MAKRQKFSISAQQTPVFDDVGAMSATPEKKAGTSISPERLAELQALMAKPAAAASPSDEAQAAKAEERVDTLLPAHHEELIDIDKLVAAPDEWNFFGKSSPEQYALIFQSVYKYGLWHPCTVWEQEDGTYMILGGHTRRMVYQELYEVTKDEKYKKIPCKVYKHDQITEPTARRIVILTNIAQRAKEDSAVRIHCYSEMALLEKEEAFYGSGVDVNTAVAKLFGVSRATVFFYRRLEKLIPELLDAYDQRQITQAVAGMLCDVPQELQQYIYEKGYHLELKPAMRHALKAAATKEDIDAIIQQQKQPQEKYQYVFSTKIKKPSNFDFVPLAIDHDEVQAFKDFMDQTLDLADNLSDHTKKVIREMLKG